MIHTTPVKIRQQPFNPALHPVKIQVVAKACFPADALLSRLFRIDFPGVKIKHAGLSISLVDVLYGPA